MSAGAIPVAAPCITIKQSKSEHAREIRLNNYYYNYFYIILNCVLMLRTRCRFGVLLAAMTST